MFFQLIVLIAFLLALWVTYRLTALSTMRLPAKSVVLFGTMCVLCAPVLIRSRGPLVGIGFDIMYYLLYFLFICFVLFAVLLMIRDMIWLACTLIAKGCRKPAGTLPYTRETLNRANIWTFAIAFFLALFALHEGVKVPRIRTLTVPTSKVAAPVDIVVLADLHLHRALFTHKLRGIVDKTNALNPDIILLPGDTIDDDPAIIEPLVHILRNLYAKDGVFATNGNHEFYIGSNKAQKALESAGIIRLSNTGVALPNGVFIAGVPDHKTIRAFGKRANIPEALTGSTPEMYRILLSHQPSLAPESATHGVDLQVSGHTHGGQIFPFHFLTKWFNGYLQGRYTVGDMLLYVSAGAGQWGPQMRLFAPAEIVHIRLQPTQMTTTPEKKHTTELPVFAPTPLQAEPIYFPPVYHRYKGNK